MTDEMVQAKDLFLLKEVRGFPAPIQTDDGAITVFMMQMRGRHPGNDKDVISQPIVFMDHKQVLEFVTNVLEWGSEAFGYAVRTEILEVATPADLEAYSPKAPPPVRTGQYL